MMDPDLFLFSDFFRGLLSPLSDDVGSSSDESEGASDGPCALSADTESPGDGFRGD